MDKQRPLVFFANGKRIEVESPNPETTLLQFLRRKLLLTGTKEACGQGGCGACTVMISQMSGSKIKIETKPIQMVGSFNLCLHFGKIYKKRSLVDSHGLQCGFCTPGMVMTMYTLFHNIPQPTADQMERALEGNLCRCTGYRPIVDAFKKISKDCPCGLGLCQQSESQDSTNDQQATTVTEQNKEPTQHFIFPPELQTNEEYRKSIKFVKGDYSWYRPGSLADLLKAKQLNPDAVLLMGCTSVGYLLRSGQMKSKTIICGSGVHELLTVEVTETEIVIGSAVTMTTLEQVLNEKAKLVKDHQLRSLKAILEAIRWIGADQIRNVATIGGHIMSQAPNHDLQTLLTAMGAQLTFMWLDENGMERKLSCIMDDMFFLNRPGGFGTAKILTSISVPLSSEDDYIYYYKQPSRRGFDYAILNLAVYVLLESNTVTKTRICIGNVDKRPIMANGTAAKIIGKKWEDVVFNDIIDELITDLGHVEACEDLKFKTTLASSFIYKLYLQMKENLQLTGTEPKVFSATNTLTLEPSTGIQIYDKPDDDGIHAVWQPIPNVGSEYIVSGEAVYIDDMPRFENELFACLVTSTRAHARIVNIDSSEAVRTSGVFDFVCHTDVPGCAEFGILVPDATVFATNKVLFYGQIIGAVLADTREIASRAAKLVKITYEDLEAVFTIDDAIEKNSFYEDEISLDEGDIDKAMQESDEVVSGAVETHGQEHFYMEPQTALAVPKIEQKEMDIYSSTQNINDLQTVVSNMLKMPRNRLNIRVRRLGGSFGGKGWDSIFVTGVVAVAALKTKRPVRCVYDRATDIRTSGKRHPVKTFFKAGVTKEGKLNGLELNMYMNAGWNSNVSYFVLFCALPLNCVYKIPNAKIRGILCQTNTPSCNEFRGFGFIQGLFVMEKIMRAISDKVGLLVNTVKETNLIKEGDTILAGMKMEEIYLHKSWTQCKQQSDYDNRLREIEKFNRENRWKKRGIAMTPGVFNMGHAGMLNQAYALVNCYTDGSVLVTHGGVEMGQGLNTKMQQVAATILQIPMTDILIGETSSSVIANTTWSGASIDADINGGAIKIACETLTERLKPFKEAKPDGTFKDWVNEAYMSRVNLSAVGHYQLPGMDKDFDIVTKTGNFALYFTHNAACSEVEIDCLTGEHQLIKADIVMDVGKSLNPALDIGQIEGGFVQGYGLMTCEALHLKPNGQVKNSGPLDYKIPGVRNIPRKLNVTLLKDCSASKAVYSAKSVGEPPLLLAVSVHNAIQEAVMAAREDCGKEGLYQLPCPATVEVIRMACCDHITKQCDKMVEKETNQRYTLL